MRADAYLGVGNTIHAISEMRALTKLTNDNTEVFFKLASLYYQLGEGEQSLNEVRECLRLDPEHKDCYPFYKKVKKVAKFLTASQEAQNSQDWQECIDSAHKVLKNEPTVRKLTITVWIPINVNVFRSTVYDSMVSTSSAIANYKTAVTPPTLKRTATQP